MAKTIKEMALEAYPVKICRRFGPLPVDEVAEVDINKGERIAFEKGATAVLRELEKPIPSEDNRLLNDAGKALVWKLHERIKELKSE